MAYEGGYEVTRPVPATPREWRYRTKRSIEWHEQSAGVHLLRSAEFNRQTKTFSRPPATTVALWPLIGGRTRAARLCRDPGKLSMKEHI